MSNEELKKELENKKDLTVAFHNDADGVYSLAMLNSVLDIGNIYSPPKFGAYMKIPGDVNVNEPDIPVDLAIDLGAPLDKDYEGYVIDHHPHSRGEKKYKLIHMHVPTGLIIWNLWKDKIPEQKSWYLAGSLTGDGQSELMPIEILEQHPDLMNSVGSIYQSYGKFNLYDYPVYMMLSSPVNALCRIGSPAAAFDIVNAAKEPLDILENRRALDAKDLVKKEEVRIFKDHKSFYQMGDVIVYPYKSKMKMTGLIASKIGGNNRKKTIIVVDEERRSLSIRGNLAVLVGYKLNKAGITAGGHAGFYGGSLKPGQDHRTVIRALKGIKQ